MAYKNPFKPPISSKNNATENKRGRPQKSDVIKFCGWSLPKKRSQPKSIIITEMLKKISEEATTGDKSVGPNNFNELSLEKKCLENNSMDPDIVIEKTPNYGLDKAIEITAPATIPKGNEYTFESDKEKGYKRNNTSQLAVCDYPACPYSCKLSSNLTKHKRTHTSEKPFMCDQCTFRSNFINSLKVHQRLHTKERPYKCKHCSYTCNSSSNLKSHNLHRHPEVLKHKVSMFTK